MDSCLTVAQALHRAARTLVGSDSPRLDAELLLAASLAVPRAQLYREPERVLEAGVSSRFEQLIGARRAGTPVPYLTGRAEFWSLDLEVDENVLVPRPETESLVECALELWPARRAGVLVDLGTGSGAVAAALAVERPQATIIASDRSWAALRVAARNFMRLGLGAISPVCGDWLAPLGAESCNLIVANPPYVAAGDAHLLDRATRFEPPQALYADDGGLSALAAIVAQAPSRLRHGGFLILEHGLAQGAAVRALLVEQGFCRVTTNTDLNGHERVSHAAWPRP